MSSLELLYLVIATVVWTVGYLHTGRFVRPKWKIPGKFIFYMSMSFVLAYWLAHWALIFILGQPLIGLIFHIMVCKSHRINWLSCQPRAQYLELQERWAKGDFTTTVEEKNR